MESKTCMQISRLEMIDGFRKILEYWFLAPEVILFTKESSVKLERNGS